MPSHTLSTPGETSSHDQRVAVCLETASHTADTGGDSLLAPKAQTWWGLFSAVCGAVSCCVLHWLRPLLMRRHQAAGRTAEHTHGR